MKVIWTDTAKDYANRAAQYARDNFGDVQVRKLAEHIKNANNKISKFPDAQPLEQNLLNMDHKYRYVTLFPHLELIYRIDECNDSCVVLLIWDTRQNPRKLYSIVEKMTFS